MFKNKKKINFIEQMIIAIILAVLFSVLLKYVFPSIASNLTVSLIMPLLDAMTNLFRLIGLPLIFLAIISGITELGNADDFSKIGLILSQRFMIMIIVCSVFIWGSVSWLFPIVLTEDIAGGSSFSEILSMILNIIPEDIISPFQSGNPLQIIFLALGIGIGCLFLKESVKELIKVINQMNLLVIKLMSAVSKIMPLYIFLCISNFALSSKFSELYEIIFPLLLIIIVSLLLPIIYGLFASIKTGISFGNLIKTQFPTYLIALTTASSVAAFQSNIECCENGFHIDGKLARIGVAIGQVTFKPGSLITLIYLSLFMAKQNEISITPTFILMMLITAAILTVATPAVPGGGIVSTTIILTQLGISLSSMAICTAILTFSDYTITACNVICLQDELLIIAKKIGKKNE